MNLWGWLLFLVSMIPKTYLHLVSFVNQLLIHISLPIKTLVPMNASVQTKHHILLLSLPRIRPLLYSWNSHLNQWRFYVKTEFRIWVRPQEFQACAADKESVSYWKYQRNKILLSNLCSGFFRFISAIKESRVLLEYDTHSFYDLPFGTVLKCSPNWPDTPLALLTDSPMPPPLFSSQCPCGRELRQYRARSEFGSFRVELTFQSFYKLSFTIPFQKAEFSSLGGTGELNSPDQRLWIWVVLVCLRHHRFNWFECEWKNSSMKEVICLEDGSLLVSKSGIIMALFPRETRQSKLSLYSHHVSSLL